MSDSNSGGSIFSAFQSFGSTISVASIPNALAMLVTCHLSTPLGQSFVPSKRLIVSSETLVLSASFFIVNPASWYDAMSLIFPVALD
ncbi:hypothetical protein Osc7112_4756 [Oscillatoria nigro-viridis PCC 7112]|uniref:Uncharacterized protein n=1 Tax=Phormidium nigroviride PCC 7112 TaxID=179408 RepID=K9VPC0_9CYAN|nr:hypothetical protein [Oscillatoria nigro-viridis]AFZ09040.1 hypothetical protein Osc7112_4756 [Oscillatoria nigro-viridis PCC 7112]